MTPLRNPQSHHAPRRAARGWRTPCCPTHAGWMMPIGMGADVGGTPAPSGPTPSFVDGTSLEPSPFASLGDEATRDLFEIASASRWLVVRGATVLPMTGAAAFPAHDVLVQDGLVRAVQPTGSPLPEGALVVEASGRYVLPGLSDMHAHPGVLTAGRMWAQMLGSGVKAEDLTLPYDLLMFLYLAGGVTRIQVLAGNADYLALRDAVRSGRFRGPAMRVASPVIDGYPAVWAPNITWQVSNAEGGREAARLVRERGYDFAKPYTRLSHDGYVALADECRALGVEMTGHIPKDVRVEEALLLGQRGVAHTFEYFYNDPPDDRRNLDLLARRARLSADLGVTAHTTLCVSRAFEYDIGQRPDGFPLEDLLDPLMRFLMKPDSPFLRAFAGDPMIVAQGRDCVEHSFNMLRALVAEGVRIVVGTDVANGNVVGRHSMHDELDMLVNDIGMTPLDALRAATVSAAEHMGEAAVAGTVESGKRADLVILERDPRRDISATRAIHAVVLGSALLRKASIATGVERAKARYAAMPVPQ